MTSHTGFRLPRICLPRPGIDLAKWAVIASCVISATNALECYEAIKKETKGKLADVVINCAGYTNMDKAELEPEEESDAPTESEKPEEAPAESESDFDSLKPGDRVRGGMLNGTYRIERVYLEHVEFSTGETLPKHQWHKHNWRKLINL
mgnify:CR=1 FL=1